MGCSSSKSTEAVTVANPAAATQSSASLSGGSGGSAASLITKRVEDGDTAVATALRAKRKGIVATQSVKTDPSYKAKHYAKTLEQEQLIFTALRENVLFATLGERECQELVKAMQPMAVSGGQQIIKQVRTSFLPSCRVESQRATDLPSPTFHHLSNFPSPPSNREIKATIFMWLRTGK
jgi:hypothetical protein